MRVGFFHPDTLLVAGLLECTQPGGKRTNIQLRNCAVRDRYVSFSCGNEIQAIRHVGVILLEIRQTAAELRGFYVGWSPSRETHHCSRLELKADGQTASNV